MIVPLAAGGAAGGTAALIARRIGGDRTRLALTWMALTIALLLAPCFLLGFAELLTGRTLLDRPRVLGLLLAALAAALWRTRCAAGPRPGAAPAAPALGGLDRAIGIVCGLAFVLVAGMLALQYEHGFETTAYTLPDAVRMFRDHTILPASRFFVHTLPANLPMLWGQCLGDLPERLCTPLNLLFLLPLGVAAHGLARAAGADRRASLLSTAGLLTVPIVAFSATDGYPDVAAAACLAIAAWFVLACPRGGLGWAILGGIAGGLAYGFKPLHLPTLVLLGLFAAWPPPGEAWRRAAASAAVFGLCALAAASFWLIRNEMLFHNPLYPITIPGLSRWLGWAAAPDVDFTARHATQFEWVRSSRDWLVYPWVERRSFDQGYKMSSGLGPFLAAFLPATLLVPPLWLASRPAAGTGGAPRTVGALLLGTVFVTGVWWFLGDRQPRYAMGALVFLFPLIGWTMTQVRGRLRRVTDGVAVLSLGWMLFVIVGQTGLQFGGSLLHGRLPTRAEFYEYPPAIDALPAGAVIVNLADRPWNYPLLGSGLHNHVIGFIDAVGAFAVPPVPPRLRIEVGRSLHPAFRLRSEVLRAWHAAYLFSDGPIEPPTDGCFTLRPVDALTSNPWNGWPYAAPRVLYALHDCAGR